MYRREILEWIFAGLVYRQTLCVSFLDYQQTFNELGSSTDIFDSSVESKFLSELTMTNMLLANSERIATENFAADLGIELVKSEVDRVKVKLPYDAKLGVSRIHGGAISALINAPGKPKVHGGYSGFDS